MTEEMRKAFEEWNKGPMIWYDRKTGRGWECFRGGDRVIGLMPSEDVESRLCSVYFYVDAKTGEPIGLYHVENSVCVRTYMNRIVGMKGSVLNAIYCKNHIFGDIPAVLVEFDEPVGGYSNHGRIIHCPLTFLQRI